MNALGQAQSLLLIGGTSEIGGAIASELCGPHTERVVLMARDVAALPEFVGSVAAEHVRLDVGDGEAATTAVGNAFNDGDVDVAIMAVGLLGDQATDEHDVEAMATVLRVNGVDSARVLLATFHCMAKQGHGTIIVLSSIAAIRPRRTNFIYGAGKATIDAIAQGLIEVGRECGVNVILVRPGFVRTRMTSGMPEAPFTVDPENVAADVVEALRKRRSIIYSPAAVGVVAGVLKVLPRPLLRKLPR